MHLLKKKQQGGALLTALFIMTLVAIVATAMCTRLQMDIYRTRLTLQHDRIYLASQGVAFWALSELGNNKNRFLKTNKQHMLRQYPKKMETIYPNVRLQGALYDLQARYNLNNLINRKAIPGFVNLLKNTTQLGSKERIQLALAVNDWLSNYDLARGEDSYLSYYTKQKPPYYPGHQMMSSASELRLVKDVDAKTYSSLLPFITALPQITPININTASKQVLMSLGAAVTAEKADELIKERGDKGIKQIGKVSELLKKMNIANDTITLESSYFLSIAYASSDNFNLTVYTLFKRNKDKKGKITATLLRQSFNVF